MKFLICLLALSSFACFASTTSAQGLDYGNSTKSAKVKQNAEIDTSAEVAKDLRSISSKNLLTDESKIAEVDKNTEAHKSLRSVASKNSLTEEAFLKDSKSDSLLADSGRANTANNTLAKMENSNNKLPMIADSSDKQYSVEIGMEYPVNFGANLKYYLGESVYSRAGVSFTQKIFLGSFEHLAPMIGYLNKDETSLIANTIANSVVVDVRLGWFPYSRNESDGGPYVEGGVSGMLFGGGEISGFNLSRVLTENNFDSSKKYALRTHTVNGTLHIGYQVPLERIKINIEVGLIKIFGVYFQDIKDESNLAGLAMDEKQKKSIESFLNKKGWIFPTVSVWIGFPF